MDFSSFLFLKSAKHAHLFTLILKKGCIIPRDRLFLALCQNEGEKNQAKEEIREYLDVVECVDVSLETRLKYTRMIQKMKPKEVSKIFVAEHGKPMASTTYKRWRREGPDLLKEDEEGRRG